MPFATYAVSLIPGLMALAAMYLGGWTPWSVPLLLFGLVPLVELFTRPKGRNATPDEEAARRASPVPDALLFAVVPLQGAIVLALMAQVSAGALTGATLAGAVVATGLGSAAYGINVAHELGHRSTRPHRLAAKALLLTTLYMHFFIEHNRGHHARVATEEDPA